MLPILQGGCPRPLLKVQTRVLVAKLRPVELLCNHHCPQSTTNSSSHYQHFFQSIATNYSLRQSSSFFLAKFETLVVKLINNGSGAT